MLQTLLVGWPAIGRIAVIMVGVTYLVAVLSALMIIIFDSRSPTKAVSWILVVIFLPILGLALYGFFGKNYRRYKLFSRKGLTDQVRLADINQRSHVLLKLEPLPAKTELQQKADIIRLLMENNKAFLTRCNEFSILENGKATFDALFEALESARDHIHIEYYIIEESKVGDKLSDILCRKASEGVEVRLIYDAVGSWRLKRTYRKKLEDAGVKLRAFMPVRFPLLASPINHRNHRKIVVIDGVIGFTGGINVSDKYIEGDPELGEWRDTHLRVYGDAALCLQTIFLTDWYFSAKEKIKGKRYFPPHNIRGEHYIQIISSGPDSDWANIMQAYFVAITMAHKHVYISTPYFIPNSPISTALETAALRGVDVRLLIPRKSDSLILTYSLYSYIEAFLRAGVRVYTYDRGFNHGKLMMVDGEFSSVGTANMDIRSFDQNFEVNALLYDKEATRQLEVRFHQDLAHSTELELATFVKRGQRRRFGEQLARLASPLL